MSYCKVGDEPAKVFQASSQTRCAPGGVSADLWNISKYHLTSPNLSHMCVCSVKRDPPMSEGLWQRPGENDHRSPHSGQGTRHREKGEQQDRRERTQPGLPEHGREYVCVLFWLRPGYNLHLGGVGVVIFVSCFSWGSVLRWGMAAGSVQIPGFGTHVPPAGTEAQDGTQSGHHGSAGNMQVSSSCTSHGLSVL